MKMKFDRLRKFFGSYRSPVFLALLFASFVLWYISKLDYDYTTEMPVTVRIDGKKFRVECVVKGKGHRLFAHKFYMSNRVDLKWDDVEISPSSVNPQAVVISPYSLQEAISARNSDIVILSIGPVPEIDLSDEE